LFRDLKVNLDIPLDSLGGCRRPKVRVGLFL